jgi:hypothetical protein
MLGHSRGAAWRQATIATVVSGCVGAAIAYCAMRPFDRETLAIQAGALRSQAAEAALAARLLREDAVTPGFARIHARQLARKVQATASELHAHPAGMLARARDEAAATARALDAGLRARPPAREPGSEAAWSALSARMDALHARLSPEG